MAVEDTIKTTIDELQKVLSAKNITGEPIEMEDKIVLPITKMGMGFGTGSSQGGNSKNAEAASGGAGGGIGVFPVAIVVVFKGVLGPEGVKVIPLGTPSALSESLGEVASAIIDWFSAKKESSEKKHDNPSAKSVEVE